MLILTLLSRLQGLLVAESAKMVTDSSERMTRAVGELRDVVVGVAQ